MKIVYMHQFFSTPKGGWNTRGYEMCRRWVAEGHSVTVITAPYEKSDVRATRFIGRQKIDGIDLVVINAADSNRMPVWKRVWRAMLFSLASICEILRAPADVAVVSSGPITVGIPGLLFRWLRRKPMVFEVRDLWPQGAIELGLMKGRWVRRFWLWFEGLCYRSAQLVVPCSVGMEASILRRFPGTPTLVIPNASDNQFFGASGLVPDADFLRKDTKVFLYVGSLGLMNDGLAIIKAMRLVRRDDIAFVFLGDGSERARLEQLSREYDLRNVHFLGLVPKTEVAKWLSVAVASVVVFKNYDVLDTSSPNKMFDSFAAGVPIIQTTKGWIRELVSCERCGVNIESNRPQEIAEAICMLADCPDARMTMAANARKLSLEKFDWDVLAPRYLDAMQAVGS